MGTISSQRLAKVRKQEDQTYFFHLPAKNLRKCEFERTLEAWGSGGRVEGRNATSTPNMRLCSYFFTHGPSTYGKVTDLDLCRLMPLYRPPD